MATGRTSQTKEYVLTYVGRYNKPKQYENSILKANPDGEILRLKDVAEVELGSEFFDIYSDINGHPAASIILKQAPGSNAAAVIEEVKKELETIKADSFPPGMDFELAYDVSKFRDALIEKVLHTLLETFILVSLVVYMFLGDLRSTLIPTLAVPVSLIGTFFVLKLFGLSINLITLFVAPGGDRLRRRANRGVGSAAEQDAAELVPAAVESAPRTLSAIRREHGRAQAVGLIIAH